MLEDKIAALTAEINLLNKNLTALLEARFTAPQGGTTAEPAEAKPKTEDQPKTEAKPAEKKPAKPDDQVEEITATEDVDDDWADEDADEEPELTIDDVRRVVAPLGPVKGRELLAKFGAKRLSEVDPTDYSALIKAAKEALA